MYSYQNRRRDGDSSVFLNINDSYHDWMHYKNNIYMHVVKISFIDENGQRHQYINDTIENIKKKDVYLELLFIRPNIEYLKDNDIIWYDRPIDFSNLNKVTKTFNIIDVLTDQEFVAKYKIT